MIKRVVTLSLLMLLVLTACAKTDGKQAVIEEFLTLQSELYHHQEEVIELMEEMALDNNLNQEQVNQELLSDIKSKVDDEAFDRLLANRMIFDESLLFGDYDKAKIKNINIAPLSSDEEKVLYQVSYDQELYKGESLEESHHFEKEFTLISREGQWKIFDIKPIEK